MGKLIDDLQKQVEEMQKEIERLKNSQIKVQNIHTSEKKDAYVLPMSPEDLRVVSPAPKLVQVEGSDKLSITFGSPNISGVYASTGIGDDYIRILGNALIQYANENDL